MASVAPAVKAQAWLLFQKRSCKDTQNGKIESSVAARLNASLNSGLEIKSSSCCNWSTYLKVAFASCANVSDASGCHLPTLRHLGHRYSQPVRRNTSTTLWFFSTSTETFRQSASHALSAVSCREDIHALQLNISARATCGEIETFTMELLIRHGNDSQRRPLNHS